MPSSGQPIANLCEKLEGNEVEHEAAVHITHAAATALHYGLFFEWLQSFVGAWNATKDPHLAAEAGLEEWDM